MPFPRKRSPIQFSEQEMLKLESIRKSRTEEKRRTFRAEFLLDSLSGQSDEATPIAQECPDPPLFLARRPRLRETWRPPVVATCPSPFRPGTNRLASISTRNNSVNTSGVLGGAIQANWMISFLSPNQGIDVG